MVERELAAGRDDGAGEGAGGEQGVVYLASAAVGEAGGVGANDFLFRGSRARAEEARGGAEGKQYDGREHREEAPHRDTSRVAGSPTAFTLGWYIAKPSDGGARKRPGVRAVTVYSMVREPGWEPVHVEVHAVVAHVAVHPPGAPVLEADVAAGVGFEAGREGVGDEHVAQQLLRGEGEADDDAVVEIEAVLRAAREAVGEAFLRRAAGELEILARDLQLIAGRGLLIRLQADGLGEMDEVIEAAGARAARESEFINAGVQLRGCDLECRFLPGGRVGGVGLTQQVAAVQAHDGGEVRVRLGQVLQVVNERIDRDGGVAG